MGTPSMASLILDLPPSCIEVCPAHPDFFVVGTYQLDASQEAARHRDDQDQSDAQPAQRNKEQTRHGSLVLFRLLNRTFKQVFSLPQESAVLDFHFHPLPNYGDVFAVVSSTGTLNVLKLDANRSPPLVELATGTPPGISPDVILTSCAWHPSRRGLIAITTSTFEVRILSLDETWNISTQDDEVLVTHQDQAWCVSFMIETPMLGTQLSMPTVTQPPDQGGNGWFTLLSGGDDSALFYASCAAGPRPTSVITTPYPPARAGSHGAGVTAILPLSVAMPDGWRLVVTGSYDDHMRICCFQPLSHSFGLKRFKTLREVNLGGGVWRLKLISLDHSPFKARILASCMHAGARIVEITGSSLDETLQVDVLARFEEHKSMNYGSDFLPASGDGRLTCLSTSFYDRLLCLWEFGPS